MKVTIDPLAERRLFAFIRAKTVEVGGMGYARLEDDGTIHWRETFLIPQEVSSTEVDFESTNGDTVAIERAITDGVLDDPNFVWVSWHSHHTMQAYWSGTDDKRIAAMSKVGVKRLLSFVGCHDGSYELRLDVFGVAAHGIDLGQVTVSKLALTREPQVPDEFTAQIRAELDENVKSKKYELSMGSLAGLAPTTGKRKKDKKSDDKSSWFDQIGDERDERRIERELRDEGYSQQDAEDMVSALGVEQCEDLLNDKYIGDRTTRFA